MAAKKKAAATKKASLKKAATAAPKLTSIRGKPWTQTQITKHLAEQFDIPQTKAKAILNELANVAQRHLAKGGVGVFAVPGIARLRVAQKPATKQRMGRNPRTGEEVVIPPRKASKVVRARPVKSLKDAVVK